MTYKHLLALAACTLPICSAQSTPPKDPAPDIAGVPGYVKLIPRPGQEPYAKITEQQRLALFASSTLSPMTALGVAAGAAISQGMNSPEEWGQGWGAYGKRFASSYGSTIIGNTITYGTSALFHEDNRYFQSHKDGLKARLGAVLISPYQARNSAGQVKFSASQFLGGVGQSTIPLAWSPSSWQGWGSIAINYSIWYGTVAGVNLARELYPSLVRFYRNKVVSSPAPAKKAVKN
jgi:hypothetical protein